MRIKEDADDYRYFPDPDLIPLQLDPAWIERVRAALPELAEARQARFVREYGLSPHDAGVLCETRALSEFFEAAAAVHAEAGPVAHWVLRDLLRALGERQKELEHAALRPEALADLVHLVEQGRLSPRSAQALLPELLESGGDPEALVRERGLEAVSDAGVLEQAVDAVLAEHPADAARYRAGEEKVLNFLMGQVMKRTRGKASPGSVREILLRRIGG
jgi:aspartyl-tRNA(Asn)/glutamyl-tRNA(Gln) amidotransferase subunit B